MDVLDEVAPNSRVAFEFVLKRSQDQRRIELTMLRWRQKSGWRRASRDGNKLLFDEMTEE